MKISKDTMLRVVLPLALAAVIIILTLINLFGGVKQTKDTYVHEAGRDLVINITDFFDVSAKTAEKITVDTSKVDAETVGTYTATAKYKLHTYEIIVDVQDTRAPEVDFVQRYVFTNDVADADISEMLEGVYDASEYTLELVRIEKTGILEVMTENSLKELTKDIVVPGNQEELKNLGTDVIPTEEGIYRAVLAATDVHGNVCYEEVYVILDTTGARIEDVPDKEVYVSADKLTEKPEVNLKDYVITDNVDGKVASADISYELELRDEANHEWLVHVSYTDRAGNESKADFLIIVKEGADEESEDADDTGNGSVDNNAGNSTTGNNNTGNANTGNSDVGNTESGNAGNSNTGNSNTGNSNTGNSNTGNSNTGNNNTGNSNTGNSNAGDSNTEYHPADTDHDGVVSPEENAAYISPEEWEVINAGYHNVIQGSDGTYRVLTHIDDPVNGFELIDEYLETLDLISYAPSCGGYIIDDDNDWYCYYAVVVEELIGPDDEEYWEYNSVYYDEENNIIYESWEQYMTGTGIQL